MEPDTTTDLDTATDTDRASAVPVTDRTEGAADDLVEDDLLVEEISIDGMCGVY